MTDEGRTAPRRGGIRPRTLLIVMGVIVLLAAVVLMLTLLGDEPPGRVQLADLPAESTATVGFAGVFPAEERALLANPLGITWDGERLYVAESDAGVVRVFDAEGGDLGMIVLPVADGASAVYPSVLAVADGRLAVVDNAAPRVIVVEPDVSDPDERAEVRLTLGDGQDAPVQPTAVAYVDGEYFVADAADGTIKVYDGEGSLLRTLGAELSPPLTYVGALVLDDRGLVVTDSNAGRVLVLDPDDGSQVAVFADRYSLPRGLAALGEGNTAVVDVFERSVALTDPDGVVVDSIDARSVPEAPLASPRGAVWLDAESRLYVTDANNGRVVVYNVRMR